MSLSTYLQEILDSADLGPEVAHQELIPPRPPDFADLPASLHAGLRTGLARLGISRLYSHQAEAFLQARAGRDLVVVTPTASGKTLCFNLPVMQAAAEDPEAKALYLFPIKALEQDQLGGFRELAELSGLSDTVRAEIYDGDTPDHLRRKVRTDPPSVVITNPDMLHVGILAYHEKWEKFLSGLRFVVLDEVHTYKGVFGSHVGHILRRLFRLARLYGADPRVICCSGTIANPGELASLLTGREVSVIDRCGAPAAGRLFLFINPKKIAASTAAARLLTRAVARDLPTIVFTKARKMTELIYTWTIQYNPRLKPLVSAYRAGYLPEERREIERKLFNGDLKAVVSTSALEMGIDIGALEVCVLVGYPGAITTTWQRGGRVGRQDRNSIVALVAQQDALDQYFMRHPEVFFRSGFEPAVVDPRNLPIRKAHLLCAAAELPLLPDDPWFSEAENHDALAELEREGALLVSMSDGSRRATRKNPQRTINIRGIGESATIFEEPEEPLPPGKKPRVIGSLDGNRVFSDGHPGAIYLHRAGQYQVTRLDLERRNLFARPVEVNYYTQPRREKETSILAIRRSKPVQNFIVRLGDLRVTERVIGYEKKRISSGERLSVHDLELPATSFDTVGLWLEIEDFIPAAVTARGLNFMGGIHAVEHAAIALFPLFALCERDDVGGISIPLHPEVKKAAIFIYDGYPGGVGLAERSFERIDALLRATLSLIRECDCENGCPSCIHSPKCGNGNQPLDKEAAVMVLGLLLDEPWAREWLSAPAEEEPPDYEPAPAAPPPEPGAPRVLVLDVETRRSAAEVGGWGNSRLMGLCLAAVWDSHDRKTHVYREDRSEALLAHLRQADLVVGFNLLGFDYLVLSAYDNGTLGRLPTFDLLYELRKKLGYRLSLGHLAEHTLGAQKSADGLQSLEWVKQGRLDLVEEYCIHDVEITRDLFHHCLEKRKVRFQDKAGTLLEMGLDWTLEEILTAVKKASHKTEVRS